MHIITHKEWDLLIDCVTNSRNFMDFEKRGIGELHEKVMEIKKRLNEIEESEPIAAVIIEVE